MKRLFFLVIVVLATASFVLAQDDVPQDMVFMTDWSASGEVNGQQIAATFIITDPGGSGTFYYLSAVASQSDGTPAIVASYWIGDRIGINGIYIENGEIVIDIVNTGPNDPLCCPTQREIQTFTLENGELVQTSSEVITATGIGLVPEDVTFDPGNLATESVTGHIIPATQYDDSIPPIPSGAPEHLEYAFDGQAVIWIYPVQDYVALWNAAGNPTIETTVNELQNLLLNSPPTLDAGLPILPPPTGVNDLSVQIQYPFFTEGRGIRFVGRLSQDASPFIDGQFSYYFQGLTSDGRYYVSVIYPVSIPSLPADVTEISADEQQTIANDFEAYRQATLDMLNGLEPADFVPNLSELDALVDSITFSN